MSASVAPRVQKSSTTSTTPGSPRGGSRVHSVDSGVPVCRGPHTAQAGVRCLAEEAREPLPAARLRKRTTESRCRRARVQGGVPRRDRGDDGYAKVLPIAEALECPAERASRSLDSGAFTVLELIEPGGPLLVGLIGDAEPHREQPQVTYIEAVEPDEPAHYVEVWRHCSSAPRLSRSQFNQHTRSSGSIKHRPADRAAPRPFRSEPGRRARGPAPWTAGSCQPASDSRAAWTALPAATVGATMRSA